MKDSRTNEYNDDDLDFTADMFPKRLIDDNGVELFHHQELVHEEIRIDRSFSELNRHSNELSTLVKVFNECLPFKNKIVNYIHLTSGK